MVGTALGVAPAAAQSWPDKPVKLIVPFGPGGASDAIARPWAEKLSEAFGKQFVIENRGGASGMIGTKAAAKSDADGYTFLLTSNSPLSVLPSLRKTSYDPKKDFVPVAHIGDMRTLLAGIPLDQMNTSMTINATAAWLLALYVANAEEQGVTSAALRGTTQNDIVKEYLSRGTYIFPPAPSKRLIVDMVAWCTQNAPKWNPMNVCSYHLQEAGATPVQEIAFSLATAIDVLDAVRDSGQVSADQFDQVFGSISFFVNAGIRFVEEVCKLRA